MPITSLGDSSDSLVKPLATVVKPLASASVTGRMASPTLRKASLPAWIVSLHFCDEVSRRSDRFLSRMPEAPAASFFSCSYSALFCT
ncbi:hypothetical protein D3C87_1929580 [compost metagenome]